MNLKEVIKGSKQIILHSLSLFVILKFYDYNGIDVFFKKVITIALITLNCIYSYRIGSETAAEAFKKSVEQTREYCKKKLDKAIEMIIAEKKSNRR